ncbi:MAG: hypothetical protein DME87_13965 [Verrucomicrobia bacterium]|nr:MAG: hypothetical protein DME87_13965 [Verrucomicrobiota bacterium]
MQLPIKITYRGLEKSDQIDNLVLDYAARLERFCDHINRCDVAIEQTNHTHQKGNPYRCRIDVTVSRGHELVADEAEINLVYPVAAGVSPASRTQPARLPLQLRCSADHLSRICTSNEIERGPLNSKSGCGTQLGRAPPALRHVLALA